MLHRRQDETDDGQHYTDRDQQVPRLAIRTDQEAEGLPVRKGAVRGREGQHPKGGDAGVQDHECHQDASQLHRGGLTVRLPAG